MKTYQISSAGIEKLQRQGRWRVVWMMILMLGCYIFFVRTEPFSFARELPVLVIASFVMAFVTRHLLQNNLKLLQAMRISVDQERITRTLLRRPDITIARQDVTSMKRLPIGLLIRGSGPTIFITSALDDYEDLISVLSQWRPIEIQAHNPLKRNFLRYAAMILMIAAMAIVFDSTNRHLKIAIGVPLAILLIWCFVAIQRDEQVDRRVKQISWLVIAGPVIALLCMIAQAFLVHD